MEINARVGKCLTFIRALEVAAGIACRYFRKALGNRHLLAAAKKGAVLGKRGGGGDAIILKGRSFPTPASRTVLNISRCGAALLLLALAPLSVAAQMGGGMEHAAMDPSKSPMSGMLGSYPMTREGSGTSWQPEAVPMRGMQWMRDEWMLMAEGFANFIYDHQGGPRGNDKLFSANMAMGMAQRRLSGGTLGLRTMLSLDPLMGKRGYPLLFQTGETADGAVPLIDRQHPHDFFMELAASYSRPLAGGGALYGYVGLPGEPALGPSVFMHRFSGVDFPEAPLTHHWFDSTHITFGVVTLGYAGDQWKVEASGFNGREPDENRWDIETRRFDSASTRLSYNPTLNWAWQLSHGYLKSPEALEPDSSLRRTTISASYHQRLSQANGQTTLAWGRNDKAGEARDGYLLESTYALRATHTVFGRLERVENDALFLEGEPLHERAFRIDKLSLGYIYDLPKFGGIKWGAGGLVSGYALPGDLKLVYGARPTSYMVFVRAKTE